MRSSLYFLARGFILRGRGASRSLSAPGLVLWLLALLGLTVGLDRDAQLQKMMQNIHKVSVEAAEEYCLGYNLVAGANLAGFKKVADAMMAQGAF